MSGAALRRVWRRIRTAALAVTVAAMAVAAVLKLGYELPRVTSRLNDTGTLRGPDAYDAGDLITRYDEVRAWFAGKPVYRTMEKADYPPGSYAILWPAMGWLPIQPARRLWLASVLIMLPWLSYLSVRGSGADRPLDRAFAALLPLALPATGLAIGMGQLVTHVLPMLIAGVLLIACGPRGPTRQLLGAALVALALVKPSISLPFLLLVLFLPGDPRPFVFAVLVYGALTLVAVAFQPEPLGYLLTAWMGHGEEFAESGYGNLHNLLGAIGLEPWFVPASLLLLGALGVWIYRHRNADPWILLGVTAIVARLWAYHRSYDNLLILVPMIALLRIALGKAGPGARMEGGGVLAREADVVAGVLLAVTFLAMLAPSRLMHFPFPLNVPFTWGHAALWILLLLFLARVAGKTGKGERDVANHTAAEPSARLAGAASAPDATR